MTGPDPAAVPAVPNLLGRRVRSRWPDGTLADCGGIVAHVSPCKAYPEVWPLAEWPGYRMPSAADRVPPVISCDVRWDAWYGSDGEMRPLPDRLVRVTWAQDARWLADEHGVPLEVPPLIETLTTAGGVL